MAISLLAAAMLLVLVAARVGGRSARAYVDDIVLFIVGPIPCLADRLLASTHEAVWAMQISAANLGTDVS